MVVSKTKSVYEYCVKSVDVNGFRSFLKTFFRRPIKCTCSTCARHTLHNMWASTKVLYFAWCIHTFFLPPLRFCIKTLKQTFSLPRKNVIFPTHAHTTPASKHNYYSAPCTKRDTQDRCATRSTSSRVQSLSLQREKKKF